MKICFIDLETTGFSREHCDIIQIAAAVYDDQTKEIENTFNEYIKPRARIPKEIENLTGIHNSDVVNKQPIWKVLKSFIEFLLTNDIECYAGHNYEAFDASFLQINADKYKLPWPQLPIIDTMKLARKIKNAKKCAFTKVNQPYLAEYFGIQYGAHNAMEDVLCLIKIYEQLIKFDN